MCSLLSAICGPALCSAQPAPEHLRWVAWTGARGASSCCLWERRPRCTGAAAGPRTGSCLWKSYNTAEKEDYERHRVKDKDAKGCLRNYAWLYACLQPVLTYDSELLCPLAKAFLAQQKCADSAVSGRGQRAFIGGPLMGELDTVAPLFVIFLIGLIGAAQSIRVIVWNSSRNSAGRFNCCIWAIFTSFSVSGVDSTYMNFCGGSWCRWWGSGFPYLRNRPLLS